LARWKSANTIGLAVVGISVSKRQAQTPSLCLPTEECLQSCLALSYCSYFFAAAFCFAHLLRCASAIFFLAKGERVLLFVVGAADAVAGGRPLRLAGEDPASASRASCRRAIWVSIAVNISEVVIAPLYQDSRVIDVLLKGYAGQHVRQRN
jgi:hypothetical protein